MRAQLRIVGITSSLDTEEHWLEVQAMAGYITAHYQIPISQSDADFIRQADTAVVQANESLFPYVIGE
jgi:hypothetical protein